jgi:uncharacterized protein
MSLVLCMKPSECVKLHRVDVLNIVSAFGAFNVRVFGSALHGTDVDGSDLDLLVDVPKGTTLIHLLQAQQLIEAKLGVRVDLLTPKDLPTSFRNAVLLEAKPL